MILQPDLYRTDDSSRSDGLSEKKTIPLLNGQPSDFDYSLLIRVRSGPIVALLIPISRAKTRLICVTLPADKRHSRCNQTLVAQPSRLLNAQDNAIKLLTTTRCLRDRSDRFYGGRITRKPCFAALNGLGRRLRPSTQRPINTWPAFFVQQTSRADEARDENEQGDAGRHAERDGQDEEQSNERERGQEKHVFSAGYSLAIAFKRRRTGLPAAAAGRARPSSCRSSSTCSARCRSRIPARCCPPTGKGNQCSTCRTGPRTRNKSPPGALQSSIKHALRFVVFCHILSCVQPI